MRGEIEHRFKNWFPPPRSAVKNIELVLIFRQDGDRGNRLNKKPRQPEAIVDNTLLLAQIHLCGWRLQKCPNLFRTVVARPVLVSLQGDCKYSYRPSPSSRPGVSNISSTTSSPNIQLRSTDVKGLCLDDLDTLTKTGILPAMSAHKRGLAVLVWGQPRTTCNASAMINILVRVATELLRQERLKRECVVLLTAPAIAFDTYHDPTHQTAS